MMVREEKFAWEKLRRSALQTNTSLHIPLRGGLFALSSRTQPVRVNKQQQQQSQQRGQANLRDSMLSSNSEDSPNKVVIPPVNVLPTMSSIPKTNLLAKSIFGSPFAYDNSNNNIADDDDDDDDPILALIEVNKTIDNILHEPLPTVLPKPNVPVTEMKSLPPPIVPTMTMAAVTVATNPSAIVPTSSSQSVLLPAPAPPPSVSSNSSVQPSKVPVNSSPSVTSSASGSSVTANGLPLSLVPYRIFYLRTRTGLRLTSFKVSPVPNTMPWLPPIDYQITWGIPGSSANTNPSAEMVRTEGTLRFNDIASIRTIPPSEILASIGNMNNNISTAISTNVIGYSLKVSPMNMKAAKDTGGLFVIDIFGVSSSSYPHTLEQHKTDDNEYLTQIQILYNQIVRK